LPPRPGNRIAAEETRELLREPLQLRGLRIWAARFPSSTATLWPEARLAAIAFASPPTLKTRARRHGLLFDFRRRAFNHLGERFRHSLGRTMALLATGIKQIGVGRSEDVDLRLALGDLAQARCDQRVVLAQEGADDEHAVQAPSSASFIPSHGTPARLPSAEKSDWRRRKSTLSLPIARMSFASSAISRRWNGGSRARRSPSIVLEADFREGSRNVLERRLQSTSRQCPASFSIAAGAAPRVEALVEKRSRSESQHSFSSSFSSGSTRITRFCLTCTMRFEPRLSCGLTDFRPRSSQFRAV